VVDDGTIYGESVPKKGDGFLRPNHDIAKLLHTIRRFDQHKK